MSQSLTERYDERIVGMLSCYGRQLPSLLVLAGHRGELVVISTDPIIEARPLFAEIPAATVSCGD
jgi:hypothetical protein